MSVTTPSPSGTPGPFFTLGDLGLPTTQTQFMAIWLAAMQAQYPGYTPAAASPEYVQALILASWAADLAQQCVSGATELFRNFGTKVVGEPYNTGANAAAVLTITAQDDSGYSLPMSTQVTLTLGGTEVAFLTGSTMTIPEGSTVGQVVAIAQQTGSSFNGATNPAQLGSSVSSTTWVAGMTAVAPASGGADQMDDDEYVQYLAALLQLMAPRPITASDFAAMALNFQPAAGTDQQEVGRASAMDGYNPASVDFTGTTDGTVTIADVSSFTGITNGSIISAADITDGQTVTAIDTDAGTITLSAAASGSSSGESMTSTGTYGNERTVTVCTTDSSGNALNSDTMTAVAAYLEALREINFLVFVIAAAYTTVYATVSIYPSQGYSSATVQANVQATLLNLLNPANYGLPAGAAIGWNNTQTVYRSVVEAAIQNTQGVDHVEVGTLALGTTPDPTNTTDDLVIGGAFPLPITTTDSIPLAAITVITS